MSNTYISESNSWILGSWLLFYNHNNPFDKGRKLAVILLDSIHHRGSYIFVFEIILIRCCYTLLYTSELYYTTVILRRNVRESLSPASLRVCSLLTSSSNVTSVWTAAVSPPIPCILSVPVCRRRGQCPQNTERQREKRDRERKKRFIYWNHKRSALSNWLIFVHHCFSRKMVINYFYHHRADLSKSLQISLLTSTPTQK